jgi:hypothetical protein
VALAKKNNNKKKKKKRRKSPQSQAKASGVLPCFPKTHALLPVVLLD